MKLAASRHADLGSQRAQADDRDEELRCNCRLRTPATANREPDCEQRIVGAELAFS